MRYDATSLDDQFMDVTKEPRAFVFQGVNFFSTFRHRKVKSLLSFKMLRTSYLVM